MAQRGCPTDVPGKIECLGHRLVSRIGVRGVCSVRFPGSVSAVSAQTRSAPGQPGRKQVAVSAAVPGRVLYGELTAAERPDAPSLRRALTGAVYEGLNLEREIMAIQTQGLGETILLNGAESDLDGLAVCHCGAGGYDHPDAYVIDDWR